MSRRRYLTTDERDAMIEAQGGLCGCGCGREVNIYIGEAEHYVCVFFGNENKPDAMWRSDCHKVKTASDRKAIAKCKRLIRKAAGTWRPNRKRLASRGFADRPEGHSYGWPTRKMPGRPF